MLLIGGLPFLISGLPQVDGAVADAFSWATISALKTDGTTRGRQSVITLKIPGTDTLPTGVAQSGTNINVTGTGVTLEDWNFSGFQVSVKSGADITTITECIFDMDITNSYSIYVESGGRCRVVSWCTFDGGSIANAGAAIGGYNNTSGASHGVELIQRNEFLNVSNDAIKGSGTNYGEQIIELNYFGPPKAWPNAKAAWVSGTTYSIDEVALRTSDGNTFVSKINNNTNNVLPPAESSDTNWLWFEPHADTIQWERDTPNGMRIRWNYFDWIFSDFNGGLTTCVYIDPIGVLTLTGVTNVYENIIDTSSTSSFPEFPRPFIISSNDSPWTTPNVYHNKIQERTGYKVMTGDPVNTINWGLNIQLSDDAAIAYNDTRMPATGPVNWDSSTPALGVDWP
ncbi:MAG: hypothetical protein COA78_20255 [Blastopirellula sp.]|nr:MAG: hypothetical protein COA78_20255 [Blastopirellula sp.]